MNIRSPKLKPTELYKHKIHVVCTLPQYGLLNKFKLHGTTKSLAKLEFLSSKKDIKFQRNLSIDILNVIGVKVWNKDKLCSEFYDFCHFPQKLFNTSCNTLLWKMFAQDHFVKNSGIQCQFRVLFQLRIAYVEDDDSRDSLEGEKLYIQ